MTRRRHQKEHEVQDVNAFMREVEETIHLERLTQLWNQYKLHLIGGISAVFIVVAGYEFYSMKNESRLQDEAGMFWQLSQSETPDEKTLLELAENGDKGYSTFAKLKLAELAAKAGNVEKQMAYYDDVINNPSLAADMRDLAKFNKAMALVNTDVATGTTLLEELRGGAYALSATEVLAYLAEKSGDVQKARGLYASILTNQAAPANMKQRVNARLDLMARAEKSE